MELLVFKGPRASELDGRLILFNWPAIGWMVGALKSNKDGRIKMKVRRDTSALALHILYCTCTLQHLLHV